MTVGIMIFHGMLLLCSEPIPVRGNLAAAAAAAAASAAALAAASVAVQSGTVIVSRTVETVPPNAKAFPDHDTVSPIAMPEASISVPANVELAPRVVACVGVQKTSQADT